MIDRIKDYIRRKLSSISAFTYFFSSMIFAIVAVDFYFDDFIGNRQVEFRFLILSLCMILLCIYLFFKSKTSGYGFKKLSKRRIMYYVETGFIILVLCFVAALAEKNNFNNFEFFVVGAILFFLFFKFMSKKAYKLELTRDEMTYFKTFENERFYFLVLKTDGDLIEGRFFGSIKEDEYVYIYNSSSYIGKGKIHVLSRNEGDSMSIKIDLQKTHDFNKFDVISTVVPEEFYMPEKEYDSFYPLENAYLHTLLKYYRDYYKELEYTQKYVESLSKAKFISIQLASGEPIEYDDLMLKDDMDNIFYPLFTNYDEIRKNYNLDTLLYKTKHLDIINIYYNQKLNIINPFTSSIYFEPSIKVASNLFKKGNISKAKEYCERINLTLNNKTLQIPSDKKQLTEWAKKEIIEEERNQLRACIKDGVMPVSAEKLLKMLDKYQLNINEYRIIKSLIKSEHKNKRIDKKSYNSLMNLILEKQPIRKIDRKFFVLMIAVFVIFSLFVAAVNSEFGIITGIVCFVTITIIIKFEKKLSNLASIYILIGALTILLAFYLESGDDIADITSWIALIMIFALLYASIFESYRSKKSKDLPDSECISDINTNNNIDLNKKVSIQIYRGYTVIVIRSDDDDDAHAIDFNLLNKMIDDEFADIKELLNLSKYEEDRVSICQVDNTYYEQGIDIALKAKEIFTSK